MNKTKQNYITRKGLFVLYNYANVVCKIKYNITVEAYVLYSVFVL